ncbi:MAG TPA: 30S ribosomal protein S24e [Candidatus Korarchaeota archaeon]|nr:30S ribosomal protein S24e [Candidatus Korarchaeota archaeon]
MPDLEVVERRKNPLLFREEITFKFRFDGPTPSRKEVWEAVTSFLGVNRGRVVVRKISQDYGMTEAKVLVMVYDSPKKLKEIESEHIIARHEKWKKEEEVKEEEEKEKKEVEVEEKGEGEVKKEAKEKGEGEGEIKEEEREA